ncbi:hypothetical protein, partial [Amycolatopsis sp. NPDC058986]|uniref:hypothetical protein n=1 Tax=Amycolatopsis sp. NPDC058986 TaxID=3346685 RepID=UPI00366FFB84
MSAIPLSPESTTEIDEHRQPRSRKTAAVPLGIWLCAPAPGDEHGLPPLIEGLSRGLVTQAVSAFTARGNTVAVTGPDTARIAAVADTGGDPPVLGAHPQNVIAGRHHAPADRPMSPPEPGTVEL